MAQLLWHVAESLRRELLRSCVWNKIDWRKLFLVAATLTLVGILVPSFAFPNQLTTWFHSSHPPAYSSKSPNGSMHLEQSFPEAKVEEFSQASTIPDIPRNFLNDSMHSEKSSTETKVEEFSQVSTTPGIPFNSTVPSGDKNVSISEQGNSVSKRRRKQSIGNDEWNKLFPPLNPHVQRNILSLSPNAALAYAKKEIEHATIVTDDPYLYGPIFRNVSVFKRSYELMETILKVYIYRDGRRPIFHKPHLNGIYASEGWFMKFMEANKKFVTKNPKKAHLFYLPYSARQLQTELYVPNSHDLRPLSIFIKDYVNMIAGKYPFWNRTHGRDHFLVACHDWGPYTLTMHEELTKNAIKALCNADLSEGVFVARKDVSLPETTISIPRRPHRNVGGGLSVSKRPILAFFSGHMHGRVRPNLMKYWHNKDEDMKIYGPLPSVISRKMTYVQHMKSSRFCLCPRGYEVNSPRIVEAIYYECVPVIIADNFVLPFDEVLDWNAFSIVVPEKDIPKLKEILMAIPLEKYLTLLTNLKMVQKHFLWNPRPVKYDLFHMILHSIWFSRVNQNQISQS
ncbi:hypothetical protein K2173_020158 [Erythroxylum novogranatense]|uniref:Exostosin GT47 domain-containing protein n=1 Tax=Erythroxylum novogranatense TaxID=1862640 RepID=A0AAV8UAN0_9ROSI|nr:hypothetical protein K2173_020158 [Erythroxylum novogranatense]